MVALPHSTICFGTTAEQQLFFLRSATMQAEALLRQATKQSEEDSTGGSLGNDRDLLITLPDTLFTVNCGLK